MLRENNTAASPLYSLARYALGFLLVMLLSFLFPKNTTPSYQFELGGRWNYPAVVAPYDIPLPNASDATSNPLAVPEEGLSLVLNQEVSRKTKLNFTRAFQKALQTAQEENQFFDVQQFGSQYLNFGHGLIGRIYQKGIIKERLQAKIKGATTIDLKVGSTIQERLIEDFSTPSEVELLIADSLFSSGLAEAEFLIPLLSGLFLPNIISGGERSEEEVAVIQPTATLITQGETIITQGAVIGEATYHKLQAWETTLTPGKTSFGVFVGYCLLSSLLIGLFLFFLQFNYPAVFSSFRQLAFLLLWFIIYGYLVYLSEQHEILSVYALPFCIVPIVVKVFFNDRLALFLHVVLILMASMLSSEDYEFAFLQILAGIVVILGNIEMRNWSRFFLSIFYIFLAYALGYLGLSLIKGGTLWRMDFQPYIWIALSVFLTLLAYPLIPLLERLFGFTSAITLLELSDMNCPLLKEMSLKAPGTLQHSLQVGNLSEAAANAIGANTLLVKVAALYHDIGKIPQAAYFIENQSGVNPHDQLGALESTKIIIDHVLEGEKMARKAGLPAILIDFIRSHHGDTRVEYFYQRFIKNNPDRQFDESLFQYPGPKPNTKEETILMIADSLEAACKSLKNPTAKDINEMVDKIVAGKIRSGQLLESAITFQELEICVGEFKKLLQSIYHVRIEYGGEGG